MNCDNLFCICWENHTCTLQEISLDIQKSCQTCVYAEISPKILEQARKQGQTSLE